MSLAASLLLSLVPQVFPGGDLKLPPRPPTADQPEVRPESELQRFRRDLLEMQGPLVKVEARLDAMGHEYPHLEALMLSVVRTARGSELENLMVVARRYGNLTGSQRVADELLFQLLARRLGDATTSVVQTMVALKGGDAKPALVQCLRAGNPALRRCAVEALAPLLSDADFEVVLELSREQSLDLRLRAVDLLRAIGSPPAIERLLQLLSKDLALAAAACEALIGLGARAVPALQLAAQQPLVDRAPLYAAFALAQIDGDGEALPAGLVARLHERLAAPEALDRCLSAVPLADLVHRGADVPAGTDAALVDALLLVVEPQQFVPNLDLLRLPSEQRLLRHTGRILAAENPLSWRSWWQVRRDSFVGVRAHVAIDAEQLRSGVLTLVDGPRAVRIVGEALAGLEPIEGAIEVVMTGEELLEVVEALRGHGFGRPTAMEAPAGLPRVRSLELSVPAGRTAVAATLAATPAFDGMAAAVRQSLEPRLWQLFRVARNEPDRGAYWRAEQRWRNAHPDPLERDRRFVRRALGGWAGWSEDLAVRAMSFLLEHADRARLLGEEEARAALASLQGVPKLREIDLRLLELVARAPGDGIWRQCLQLAIERDGGGPAAVRGVFQVLGADLVLVALGDEDPLVRRAAIDEVIATRDLRASERLVELLADPSLAVRRGAVFACGQLQVTAASRPLIAAIVAENTEPELRRDCLRALGRVGGEQAFEVLQRAITAPVAADKSAAMRGLGELRDARAAALLAELAVVGGQTELGQEARFHLQRQGALLAVPALRAQLARVADDELHAQLVLLLGFYQDPRNVPDLMDLLHVPKRAAEATALLECTTGVDLTNVQDRVVAIDGWWRTNQEAPQWRWLLTALAATGVSTELLPEHFAPGAEMAPVAELARLMVEAPEPRLFVLSAAVLRTVTQQDYGAVTPLTPPDIRAGFAARYHVLAEVAQAR